MLNFLIKLRKRPENEKLFFLFWGTLIFFIFLVFTWYFLTGIEWGTIKYVEEEKKEISGINFIGGLFKDTFFEIGKGFKNLKN